VKKIQKTQNAHNAQIRRPKLAIASEQIRVLTDLSHVVGGSSTNLCSEMAVTCTNRSH
jgi:hypothetical protein